MIAKIANRPTQAAGLSPSDLSASINPDMPVKSNTRHAAKAIPGFFRTTDIATRPTEKIKIGSVYDVAKPIRTNTLFPFGPVSGC